jgi:hypothetical protein
MSNETVVVKDINGEEINVLIKTMELFNAVKLKDPMLIIKEGCRKKSTLTRGDEVSVTLYRGVELIHASNPEFIVGGLMYIDDKYVVESRLIENNKYAHYNGEHRCNASQNMKNIVKIALNKLKPLQINEVARKSQESCRIHGDISDIRHEIARLIRDEISGVSRAEIFVELLHMRNMGYKPKGEAMGKLMAFANKNEAQFREDYEFNPEVRFVYINPNNTLTVTNQEGESIGDYPNVNSLPEDILSKLTVLMLSPDNTFIRGIGKKDKENMFWITL